ncbi:MAG: 16S rRNA (cytosine(967)-C(5))-methyltransferase RsmB [Pseudomonadota bacterium]
MFASPRQVALSVLNDLDQGKETLDAIMERAFRKNIALERRDRALIMELVYGVLRQRAAIDWVIDQVSRTPRSKMDATVLNVVRLGIYQLLYTDRIPPSAAINESVNLVKVGQPDWIVSFVNGVLRAVERERDQIKWPDPEADPVAAISVETSHPVWLVERWVNRYGLEETRALCESNNRIPVLSLRTNTLRIKPDQLLHFLRKEVPEIEASPYSPVGLLLKGFSGNVTRITGYKTGWFLIQDESSQVASYLLSPQPGDLVLDACAGLGGKTTHLAQMMRNLGRIMALDIHGERLERLNENAGRLGIQCIEIVKKNVTKSLSDLGAKKFDRILVDAPCTGLGVIRRNPDVKWRINPEDLKRMAERQVAILEETAPLLKDNGIIVYSTCSLEPEENEEVIDSFLSRHDEFEKEDPRPVLPEKARELVEPGNFLRTCPHRHGMDGFSAVRMRVKRS